MKVSPLKIRATDSRRVITETFAAAEASVAARAYEKFEARGHVHGFDEQDWRSAEHEIRAESAAHEEN